jgi:hypothetical protein
MSSYIGNTPQYGVFRKLDAFTFNGSTTTFTLNSGGVNVIAGDPTQLFISLNGVIQEPGVAFTLANGGTQITFASAPTVGMSFFGVLLGNTGAPTIEEGQVTTTKIANSAVTTAKVNDGAITEAKLDSTLNNTLARKGTAIALSIALG